MKVKEVDGIGEKEEEMNEVEVEVKEEEEDEDYHDDDAENEEEGDDDAEESSRLFYLPTVPDDGGLFPRWLEINFRAEAGFLKDIFPPAAFLPMPAREIWFLGGRSRHRNRFSCRSDAGGNNLSKPASGHFRYF